MNNTFNVFNSPLETGLRCMMLLVSGYPNFYDIDRIIFYDYLLAHSGDIAGGPISIHPSTPHRSGEILIRRPMLENGLKAMIFRGLIEVKFSNAGVEYAATELASPFLESLEAQYTKKMMNIADWVVQAFDNTPMGELKKILRDHITIWGGEFLSESVIRGELFHE